MKHPTTPLALGIILFFIASIPAAAGSETIVTDDFGTEVAIQGIPQRIVSLSPANTEILFALGLGDRVVAVTDFCTYPPEAKGKDTVGGYYTVNIEKVVAARPDLILAADGNTMEVIERLRSLGLTVIALDSSSIEEVIRDIEMVGRATGSEQQAGALIQDMQARIRAVEQKTAQTDEKPTVVHIIWNDPIWVSGNNTFQDRLIQMAGGVNAFPAVQEYGIISLEEFIQTDPDIIIVNSGTGMNQGEHDVLYHYFVNEPRMRQLSAIQEGRVYIVDSDIVDRGGPRIIDAMEIFASYIHPALFAEADPEPSLAPDAPGFGAIACIALIMGFFAAGLRRKNTI
jgi:iron complex transport system substrate-binding protein